ncbi:MAG: UvrD-helicase domain-containing protein, partial [Micropruina sp.]
MVGVTQQRTSAGITLDAAQTRAVGHDRGAMLVIGGPGSGKTTVLVEAAIRRLAQCRPGDRQPLLLTFSRRAASELRNRITRALARTMTPPLVMTTHALCLWLHQRFAPSERGRPRLLTAPEQEFRVRELLAGNGPRAWPEELAGAVHTRGFARQVRAVLARARQLGLDPEDLV